MIVRENNGEPPWESSLPATEKAYTIINKCKIKWEKGDFVYFILLKKWKVEGNFCRSYLSKSINS